MLVDDGDWRTGSRRKERKKSRRQVKQGTQTV